MIGISIKTSSLKRAFADVKRSHSKKSLSGNKSLGRKVSRRFRAAAKAGSKDLARAVSSETGLTVPQSRRRVRSSKKISSSKFHSEIFSRGRSQDVHAGRLRQLRVTKKGVSLRGKRIAGAFITSKSRGGKRELRRVLINPGGGGHLSPFTFKRQLAKVYKRRGPSVLRRQSRKLQVSIGRLIREAK